MKPDLIYSPVQAMVCLLHVREILFESKTLEEAQKKIDVDLQDLREEVLSRFKDCFHLTY